MVNLIAPMSNMSNKNALTRVNWADSSLRLQKVLINKPQTLRFAIAKCLHVLINLMTSSRFFVLISLRGLSGDGSSQLLYQSIKRKESHYRQ